MFTDTKNLVNVSTLDLTLPPLSGKPKGKLRKVWKPLLRWMSFKSVAKNENGSRDGSIVHPNNINLNNVTSTNDFCTLPTALENYVAVISKVAVNEEYPREETEVNASSGHKEAVISSASIDKTPISTCTGCAYGRNCQHQQFHPSEDHTLNRPSPTCLLPSVIEMPSANEMNVPIHYICTDDGTFFWTTAEDKADDDLLNAWLCHSFRQFPVQETVL